MNNVVIVMLALGLIALGFLRRFSMGGLKPADPEQVREMVRREALIVDVRGPDEFAADHYEGAVNVPVDELHHHLNKFGSQDTPVLLYCNTGRRSSLAIGQLQRRGYRYLLNAGGLHQLRDAVSAGAAGDEGQSRS